MKKQSFYVVGAMVVVALTLIYFYGVSRRVEGFSSTGSGVNTLTMYYVDWCPHCTHAKPDFEKLKAESPLQVNGKGVEVGMVNPEKEPEAAKGKPVKGYPTILLQKASGETVEYQGERAYGPLKEFLKENV
jgi:thiol-disulfide isomerase/thioredoxin